MLVLLIVCFMKLIEMYTNNNRMARRSARNTKENCFGLQNVNQKYGMIDESFAEQRDADRYSMNYFYDIDQSCVDQLKEFLHQKSGNEYTWTDPKQFTRLSVTRGFRLRHHDDLHVSNSSQRKWSMFLFLSSVELVEKYNNLLDHRRLSKVIIASWRY